MNWTWVSQHKLLQEAFKFRIPNALESGHHLVCENNGCNTYWKHGRNRQECERIFRLSFPAVPVEETSEDVKSLQSLLTSATEENLSKLIKTRLCKRPISGVGGFNGAQHSRLKSSARSAEEKPVILTKTAPSSPYYTAFYGRTKSQHAAFVTVLRKKYANESLWKREKYGLHTDKQCDLREIRSAVGEKSRLECDPSGQSIDGACAKSGCEWPKSKGCRDLMMLLGTTADNSSVDGEKTETTFTDTKHLQVNESVPPAGSKHLIQTKLDVAPGSKSGHIFSYQLVLKKSQSELSLPFLAFTGKKEFFQRKPFAL
ncbi:unnamed protein product [Ranitomeya imitator]|uniref:Uncharacterized protein n=1 Tax=Ranitomeya imitator TaxID=111125 RepID=A0ABN9M465_9NEOB|nr:unnamed protein product [Ranitomeya imitator]